MRVSHFQGSCTHKSCCHHGHRHLECRAWHLHADVSGSSNFPLPLSISLHLLVLLVKIDRRASEEKEKKKKIRNFRGISPSPLAVTAWQKMLSNLFYAAAEPLELSDSHISVSEYFPGQQRIVQHYFLFIQLYQIYFWTRAILFNNEKMHRAKQLRVRTRVFVLHWNSRMHSGCTLSFSQPFGYCPWICSPLLTDWLWKSVHSWTTNAMPISGLGSHGHSHIY